jgi:flavin reductase (DIM6/NTAB) family NADH-FMN oxidoreductase RutF
MSTPTLREVATSFDAKHYRRVCSRFASGVTIVTVKDSSGILHGMTASSFTSVSLRPPLILVCVGSGTRILEAFESSDHFCVNVLCESQRRLSERFAGTGYDRFEGIDWHSGATGSPLLPGVLATFECARFRTFNAGDHDILIGQVLHAECRDGEPLVHFASQYRGLEAAPGWWSTIESA